jgi:hypothetical protein
MAEIYDNYTVNAKQLDVKSRQDSRTFGKALFDVAMDQTDLLKEVRRRVQAFVDAYEPYMAMEVEHIAELRARPNVTDRLKAVADNMELDVQTLRSAPADPKNTHLFLDDLKILLDQFPQKD